MNRDFWTWNNGAWTYKHAKIRLCLFSSYEARDKCGILYIGKIAITDGLTLGAKDYEEGEKLICKFILENDIT